MSFLTQPLSKFTDWALHPQRKRVYSLHEGSIEDKELLGNKGANLCEMSRIGMPVPPGVIITTEACLEFIQNPKRELNDDLVDEYRRGVHDIEKKTGMFFGAIDSTHEKHRVVHDVFPLLLSVRSGAAVSMPGMMDTVLNLGMSDTAADIMSKLTNPRFTYDTYRRFLQMFGIVVLGMNEKLYEDILCKYKAIRGVDHDNLLLAEDLIQIVHEFKGLAEVPQDPWKQLSMAIIAVFQSWFNPRAVSYRDIHNIPNNLGTAVTIQSMVYGNFNERSGSGVAFTRNPGTGENVFYGEYLSNAEGEDVVAGIRTPVSLDELKRQMRSVYDNLVHIEKLLERHYRDMQDIEFTVQNGTLYILQTRSGKRTARAAVRIAVSMVQEGLITERDALLRIDPEQMTFFMHPMIDPTLGPELAVRCIGSGLPASAGSATGVVVFNCNDAMEMRKKEISSILCREQTSADDIDGMQAAEGVLTCRGGLTSHAAIVMRNMGKAAVVGAQNIFVDVNQELLQCGSDGKTIIKRGDIITIDGSTGNVYKGAVPTVPAGQDEDFKTILRWADKYKRMKILANADTVEEAKKANEMRAEGLGLCRTEHMFFAQERLDLMRGFILSQTPEERCEYLAKMMPHHQSDFEKLLKLFPNKQVTIRLLDPPLHEFLPSIKSPTYYEDIRELASRLNMEEKVCLSRCTNLYESNPMLGFRGCRLSIVYPELTDMQTRSILGAASALSAQGINCNVQIMFPLICSDHEIESLTPIVSSVAKSFRESSHTTLDYQMGVMLEVPRAFMRIESIVQKEGISFVSIGSNDLTQFTYGFSRDDAGRFLPIYLDKHIFADDPFKTIDQRGVGSLIANAVTKIRNNNSSVKIGVCGEHAGDAKSVAFFDQAGIDYVSCSPYRIPVARIAAAQSRIKQMQNKAIERAQLVNLARRYPVAGLPFPVM